MSLRIENLVTSGTFSLDGGTWDVDNNVWIVGDDDEVIVIDPAHDAKAVAVAVGDLAAEDPGHDLHVAMSVGAEAAVGGDDVVVVDEQEAVLAVLAVVVIAEVHRVLGIEPPDVGDETILGTLDGDAHVCAPRAQYEHYCAHKCSASGGWGTVPM